ncbi:MAG: hypothetical protein QXO15_03415 [Nitrososphaerota archaeon]
MYEALKRIGVTSVPCFDFTSSDGKKMKRTCIIAPIRIQETEDGSLLISWTCSRGSKCYDPDCRYSRTAKEEEKCEGVC